MRGPGMVSSLSSMTYTRPSFTAVSPAKRASPVNSSALG